MNNGHSNFVTDFKTFFLKAKEIPGIKIFRFDGAVYFANAERFKTNLYKYTGLDPKALKNRRAKLALQIQDGASPAEAQVSLVFRLSLSEQLGSDGSKFC